MPPMLGKYTLLQTLGSGANSKVKLGLDKQTGQYYAIKILKKQNHNLDSKFLELVMTEVKTLLQLSHPNILNMTEYNKDGIICYPNGKHEKVIYIVLELAKGGELFDYIAVGGKFSEQVSRFYFKQLIDGLSYVHSHGITHRDLKPENILYDQSFNLKIADFGFAAPARGKDGSGYLKTRLGTESYMAPEIHSRKVYSGESVDLFAAGIILFIMFTQHPPFHKATPDDPFYKLICINRMDVFWKAHSKNKPGGDEFFPEDFKDLIQKMLQYRQKDRLTMNQVKNHPWFKKEDVATLSQIVQDFSYRKLKIERENNKKQETDQRNQELQQQKEKLKQKILAGKGVPQKKVYKKLDKRDLQEENKYDINEDREMTQYIQCINKQAEILCEEDPKVLFELLVTMAEDECTDYKVSKSQYKIKVEFQCEGLENVILTIQFLQMTKDKFCINLTKKQGDWFAFKGYSKRIRNYLDEFIQYI